MTVEELIERLSKLKKDRPVKVWSVSGTRDIDNEFDVGYHYKNGIEFYEL